MPVTIVIDTEGPQVALLTSGESLSSCPICNAMPEECSCLRPSVRRRIARELKVLTPTRAAA